MENNNFKSIDIDLEKLYSQLTNDIDTDNLYDEININKSDETAIQSITTPINVGEKCTIEFAKRKNIFDKDNYIIDLTEDELQNINTFKNSIDNIDGSTSICKTENNIAYENCPLAMNNPYLSMNKDSINNETNVCSLSKNTVLPYNSRYTIEWSKNNIIKLPETEIYFSNNKKAFCQERWNDWFCIPNYHIGNRWYNELPDDLQNTKTVGNCFMPCELGHVPSEIDPTKCIIKSEYLAGAYAKDFDYMPLALVCLLGTSFETFKDEKTGYVSFMSQVKKTIEQEDGIELLKNDKNDIITSFLQTSIRNENNPIWLAVKDDIKQYIHKLFLNIKSSDTTVDFLNRNIIPPADNVKPLLKTYLTKDKILYAYNIAKTIKDRQIDEVEKYKDWRFNLHKITNIPNDQFKFLLKMLKRACNVCFDGKTPFSSDLILFTLNKDKDIQSQEEYDPISIDENYDPEDVEFVINDFNLTPKAETNMFDDYKQYFKLYESSLYTYLTFVIISVIIFALYILYIVFHSSIVKIINYVITFFIYRYYDVVYFFKWLLFKHTIDNRDQKRLEMIQYYLEAFRNFDKKYLV